MPHRRDHQVPRRVRELVEQHDRALAAVDDEARVAELAACLLAEDAAFGGAGLLNVCKSPGRPELPHSASCITYDRRGCGADSREGACRTHSSKARNRPRASGRAIGVVVIHTMEIPERAGAAETCARWFANRLSRSRRTTASTPTITIQCVREEDIAWHARGGNANSIGIELAGYAGQRALGWGDAYSRAVLDRAARLTAGVCERHGIPIRRLRAADLVAGRRGITGHADVSAAFRKSDHWDPGPGFPLDAVPPPGARQRRRRGRPQA